MASAHTYGCVAATAAIAASASLGMASVFIDKMDDESVAKNIKAVMKTSFPIHMTYIIGGTLSALVQASNSPHTRNLWLGSAALLGSVLPYTFFLCKEDTVALFKAGEEKKAPAAGVAKRLATSGYIRVSIMTASTLLMVYALAKKKK